MFRNIIAHFFVFFSSILIPLQFIKNIFLCLAASNNFVKSVFLFVIYRLHKKTHGRRCKVKKKSIMNAEYSL